MFESESTQFVASPRTKEYKLRPVFHYPPNHPFSCQWSQELNPSNWQEFNSREDARSDGYQPCAECGIDSEPERTQFVASPRTKEYKLRPVFTTRPTIRLPVNGARNSIPPTGRNSIRAKMQGQTATKLAQSAASIPTKPMTCHPRPPIYMAS